MYKLTLFFSLLIIGVLGLNTSVLATSGACSWHGGVDCSAGADWDGSVICNDGWTGSSVSYSSMVSCQSYDSYSYNYSPSYENWKAFAIYKVLSSEIVVVDEYANVYLIDYDYSCSSLDFEENEIVYIDTYYSPSYGDDILVEGLFDTKTCQVFNAEELDLESYYVHEVFESSDNILVEDDSGAKYLVEYGLGCLSMWRYEEEVIDIDIGGSFLDGISDQIYLFDTNDDCKVWDAELSSSNKYTFDTYASSCPANSYADGEDCYCNVGYIPNTKKDGCILDLQKPTIDNNNKATEQKDDTKQGDTYGYNHLNIQSGWLVKSTNYAEVFYVDEQLCLHWVMNEEVAERNYGSDWNKKIHDFDTFGKYGYKFCETIE